MPKILVTEKLAEKGLDQLRTAGHTVDVRLGLSPADLVAAVPGYARLSYALGDDDLAEGVTRIIKLLSE